MEQPKKEEHEERFAKILTSDLSGSSGSRFVTLVIIVIIVTVVAVVVFYGYKKMKKDGDKADPVAKSSPQKSKSESELVIQGSK